LGIVSWCRWNFHLWFWRSLNKDSIFIAIISLVFVGCSCTKELVFKVFLWEPLFLWNLMHWTYLSMIIIFPVSFVLVRLLRALIVVTIFSLRLASSWVIWLISVIGVTNLRATYHLFSRWWITLSIVTIVWLLLILVIVHRNTLALNSKTNLTNPKPCFCYFLSMMGLFGPISLILEIS